MSIRVKNPFLRFLLTLAVFTFFACLIGFALKCAVEGVYLIMFGIFNAGGTWRHVLAGGLWLGFGAWILSHVKIEWRK